MPNGETVKMLFSNGVQDVRVLAYWDLTAHGLSHPNPV